MFFGLIFGIYTMTEEMNLNFFGTVKGQAATAVVAGPVLHPRLRVAMIQMDVIDGDLEENMGRAERYIRESAFGGADLACLPEAPDFGWLCQKARESAFPIPGPYTDFLSGLARKLRLWIAAGCLEKADDKTYNAAVLIDRSGSIVLKHRKITTLPELTAHLYDAGDAGDIKVADTEFGRVGLTICADNFDIENPKRAADLGAWLLIAPHGFAEKKSDLLDNGITFINHIKNVAQKTKLWVIGTNTVLSEVAGGQWKGYLHSGCSTIADPNGKVRALGGHTEPELIFLDIPLAFNES